MEILRIKVYLTGNIVTKGQADTAVMLPFTGECDGPLFKGKILPGGVDTQMYLAGAPGRLSARYMLAGTDASGTPTRLFIENNGEYDAEGTCITRPRILTDNPALTWLEQTPLTGRIAGREGGVTILMYKEETP